MILEPRKIKSATVSVVSPPICHEVMGPDAMILVFWMLSFKTTFSLSISLSSRGSLVLLNFLPWRWCHLCIWGYWYFLIPACASSSPAFLMIYSAYKLNKQGDNIQPWHTPFPIWNQSVVPCPVLIVASWPAYRAFLFLLAILWNAAFKWVYLSFSPLLFASLVLTASEGRQTATTITDN